MNARVSALEEARRLVVVEGCSYAEAARATGIPESTLQKRGAAQQWQDQRDGNMTYGAQVRALKGAMLTRLVLMSQDNAADAHQLSQLLASWTNLERTFPEHRYGPADTDPRAQLAAHMTALDAFLGWLVNVDPPAVNVLRQHVRGFIQSEERRLAA